MIVGFTGTRKGMTPEQVTEVDALLAHFKPTEAHHGGCKGADEEFHELCQGDNIKRVVHWSSLLLWRGYCPLAEGDEGLPARPPLKRNIDIARAADTLIATPKEYIPRLRSGTWHTIRCARVMDTKVIVVFPDGSNQIWL